MRELYKFLRFIKNVRDWETGIFFTVIAIAFTILITVLILIFPYSILTIVVIVWLIYIRLFYELPEEEGEEDE